MNVWLDHHAMRGRKREKQLFCLWWSKYCNTINTESIPCKVRNHATATVTVDFILHYFFFSLSPSFHFDPIDIFYIISNNRIAYWCPMCDLSVSVSVCVWFHYYQWWWLFCFLFYPYHTFFCSIWIQEVAK